MRKVLGVLGLIVLALLVLGIVMLMSTSSVRAEAEHRDAYYFVKRQGMWLLIAVAAGYATARCDYHLFQKYSGFIYGIAILLAVAVLIPHIGHEAGGSNRWLRLGPLSFQPSELAKVSVIIALSSWMARKKRHASTLVDGLIKPCAILGAMLVLLIAEPDYGTTLLTAAVGMLILLAGGSRLQHLAVIAALGLTLFTAAVIKDPLRSGRILAFLMPEKYPATAYHLSQSKLAFIRGGMFGVGLGNSIQKQFYLPEAHTDFILAIIGEELGFAATLLILLLFVGILVIGMYISMQAPDAFGRLMAFGITMMLVMQAAINVGVVTGCLPTKGLPLPFISYGGSSLVGAVAAVGILMNIGLHVLYAHEDDHTRVIRDRAREV